MPRQTLFSVSSARRQHLLVEFASLKYAAPPGVYMSLSPTTNSLWFGVLFVRRGPYKGGIFKFTISFPSHYPAVAPTITFQNPPWHPLVYAPSASAPGVFSLRHGFPRWFSGGRGVEMRGRSVTTMEVVEYVKSVFDDGQVLDRVPGSAAGNMGAWKAWRHRAQSGVWAEKVRVAVSASGGDGVLYSSVEGDEPIRFLDVEEGVKEIIVQSMQKGS